MIRLSLILLLIIPVQAFSNEASLPEIRSLYGKAADHEKSCKILSELQLPGKGENLSVIAGYKAAATMVLAKHVFNPVSKISYFRKGKIMLEAAIVRDPKNVELRFLRFTIQTNAPSFLGYNTNLETDKQFLRASVAGIKDPALKSMVARYLSDLKA